MTEPHAQCRREVRTGPSRTFGQSSLQCFLLQQSHMHSRGRGVAKGPSRTFELSFPLAFRYLNDMAVQYTARMHQLFHHAVTQVPVLFTVTEPHAQCRREVRTGPSRTFGQSSLQCFLLQQSHMHSRGRGVAKGPCRTFELSFPLAFRYLNDMAVQHTARMPELFHHAVTITIDPCQGAVYLSFPASTPSWHAP